MAKKGSDSTGAVFPAEYVRPRDVVRILGRMVAADIPTILVGPPGIGKTCLAKDLVSTCKRPDGKVRFQGALVINISYRKPTFVGGQPIIHEQEIKVGGKKAIVTVAKYVPPSMLPMGDSGKDTLIIWDDISSCPVSVQAAFLEVLHERMVGDFPLPEGVYQIGTANRAGDHSAAFELSSAMISRCAVVGMRPDWEDSRNYALKHEWDNRIPSFISFRPNLCFSYDAATDAGKNFPCGRTWEACNKVIQAGWRPESDALALATASALVGPGAAGEFIAFVKTYGQLPDSEEVFRGKSPKCPDDPAAQYAWAGALSAKAAEQEDVVAGGGILADYCLREQVKMPPEFAVLTLRMFLNSPKVTHQVVDRLVKHKAIVAFTDKFGNVLVD